MIPGIVAGASIGSKSFFDEVMFDAPYLYYRLGETTGSIALDSSGNARNGQYVGTIVKGQPSLLHNDGNFSAKLDGAAFDAKIKTNITAQFPAFTIEFLLKPESVQQSTKQLLASKRSYYAASMSDFPFTLERLNDGSCVVSLTNGSSYNADLKLNMPSGSLQAGATKIITFVCREFGLCELFLDGVLLDSKVANFALSNTSRDWCFGAASYSLTGGLSDGFFNGTMDELQLYDKALSGERILAHAKAAGLA